MLHVFPAPLSERPRRAFQELLDFLLEHRAVEMPRCVHQELEFRVLKAVCIRVNYLEVEGTEKTLHPPGFFLGVAASSSLALLWPSLDVASYGKYGAGLGAF